MRGLGYPRELRRLLPSLVRWARMYRSQGALAKALGVSPNAIHQWENGVVVPNHESLARLWAYLEAQGRV